MTKQSKFVSFNISVKIIKFSGDEQDMSGVLERKLLYN